MRYSKESLIRVVALEKIRRAFGFQIENKIKKSQALKELSNVVFIWLGRLLLRTESWKKIGITKTCCDPDRNSSAKREMQKQTNMWQKPKIFF